jgi:hypothetical protein
LLFGLGIDMEDKEKIISAFISKRKYFNLSSKTGLGSTEGTESRNVYIIDFYNIYCNFVKFDKYKIFSKETFSICINLLIDYFDKDTDTCIIVSKNIYEVGTLDVQEVLKDKNNIVYIIAEDNFNLGIAGTTFQSKNKERDDYTCIMLYNLLKHTGPDSYLDHSKNLLLVNSGLEDTATTTNVSIVTNDTYRNYNSLLKNVKPFNMKIINFKTCYDIPINRRIISMYNVEINGKSVDRIGFNFANKKK